MGVLLSKKLEHPVQVHFTCERCGEENTFAQDFKVAVSKEIPFNSRTQSQEILKLDEKAHSMLRKKIEAIERQVAEGKFSWVDNHPCAKCKAAQSWQKSSLWWQLVAYICWYPLIAILFGRGFSRFITGDKPFLAWVFYLVLGGLSVIILLVMIDIIRSLSRVDRTKQSIPTVDI